VVHRTTLSVADVAALKPTAVVLSPGRTPAEAGILVPLVRALAGEVPILGVCLATRRSAKPRREDCARSADARQDLPDVHSDDELFDGIPSRLRPCGTILSSSNPRHRRRWSSPP
jgi:anthranilate synthase component 2